MSRSLEPFESRPALSGRGQQRLIRIVRRHQAGCAGTPWHLLLPEAPAPIRPQRRRLSRERGANRKNCRSRHRNSSMMHAYPRTMDCAGGGIGGLSGNARRGGVIGGLSSNARRGGVIGGLSNSPKAELAIAQPAIKATRLTFIMNAPNLNC